MRRRWLPHREGKGVRARIGGKAGLKRRAERLDFVDGGLDVGLDFDLGPIGVMLLIVAAIVLLFVLGGPIVLIGIDLIWMLSALLISTFARFVLGHPWRVEADVNGERSTWDSQGFRAAGRMRGEVRTQLDLGIPLDSITLPEATAPQ